MAKYRYAGPGPQEDGDGGLVRPGDEREFGTEPDWGPWELIEGVPAKPDDSGDGAQAPATPPATSPPATPPASSATASTTAPAATSAPEPKTGM